MIEGPAISNARDLRNLANEQGVKISNQA